VYRIRGANIIWKFADQKVNVFGPAHIEKSHFKENCGCIFRQSLMKYGENKSIKENSLWSWVLIPGDNRHSTVTRKIRLFYIEPVTISYIYTYYWVHWFLPVKYFTCKNYLDWDIFRYFYFFTKYIALLSLIVNKNEHCHFVSYFFLTNLQLNIGKKYLKTAIIIDESS
jgi:hypothetical protein